MRANLFYKVLATYIIIILLAMAVVGYMGSRQLRERILRETEANLKTFAGMVALMASKESIKERIVELTALSEARITLIDGNGDVLADSDAPTFFHPPPSS